MSLLPQTKSLVSPLLAIGVVRHGTDGELYDHKGALLKTALTPVADPDDYFIPLVDDVEAPVTGEQFNALVLALRARGVLAQPE